MAVPTPVSAPTTNSTEGELPPIPLSFFENTWDNHPKQCVLQWPEIVTVLSKHKRRGTMETPKAVEMGKGGPLFSPVMYRPGATRGNAGVEYVVAAVADVDCGISPNEFLASFPNDVEVIITSTHSSTPEKPKFRAITPLMSPVPASEWPTVWRQFQANVWSGVAHEQTKAPANLYYLPSCPQGAEPFVIHRRGRALDWRKLPPLPAKPLTPKDEPRRGSPASKVAAGDDDDDVLGVAAGSGPRPDRDGLPGTDFSARADWGTDILERHGWEEVRGGSGDERRWKCSRHAGDLAVQTCATTGHSAADLLHVFCHANGTPFEGDGERNYSMFRALSLLEYGGDDAECARALADLGYGERTSSPSSGVDAGRQRGAIRLLTASELKRLPPPVPLIDGVLFRDSIAVLDGNSGTYKSFIALDMALSVATGTPWQGHAVHQGGVLYIVAEGTSGMTLRVEAWEVAHDLAVSDCCHFVPGAVNFLNNATVDELCEIIRGLPEPPTLIIADTLARSMAGGDENASKDMGLAIAAMDKLRTVSGATVLTLHHVNRANGDIRGHSSLRGALDTELKTTRNNDGTVTLTCEKQKDAAEFHPITLLTKEVALPDGGSSLVLAPRECAVAAQATVENRVLGVLRECGDLGATATEWERRCDDEDISRSTFFRAKGRLLADGRVFETNPGKRGNRFRASPVVSLTA